jgi:hypothetical protein
VFGTQDSYDDDMPFQMLDEEAAGVGSSSAGGGDENMPDTSPSDFPASSVSDSEATSFDFGDSPFGNEQ